MAKIVDASCQAGVVKVSGLTIPGARILSGGVGPSIGVLVIDGAESTYIAKTVPDLETTLEKAITAFQDLASVLNTIATTLTSIGAGMTGPTTAPPPTLAAGVTLIVSKATAVTASSVALQTLKGSLK